MTYKIKFGTDGWRGVIAEDYTFDNVRRAAQGFASYLLEKGYSGRWVVVGHDKRFHSENFAAATAEVLVANGLNVYLTDDATPTPVIAFAVVEKKACGAVNITASQGRADWAHCGDSRIYHCRNGERIARSVDHSLVMRKMVLPGYLTEEQAESHPNKNILVSCLGDADRPEIDHGQAVPVQGGDCFMLCSDGLWAYFKDEEMGRILAENPPRQAASILIDAARERAKGRGDNCSLAIVKITETEEPKGVPPPPWK